MIEAVVDESLEPAQFAWTTGRSAVMNELRDFMFAVVYQAPASAASRHRAIGCSAASWTGISSIPDEIPASYRAARSAARGAGGRLRRRHDRPLRARHPRRIFRPSLRR